MVCQARLIIIYKLKYFEFNFGSLKSKALFAQGVIEDAKPKPRDRWAVPGYAQPQVQYFCRILTHLGHKQCYSSCLALNLGVSFHNCEKDNGQARLLGRNRQNQGLIYPAYFVQFLRYRINIQSLKYTLLWGFGVLGFWGFGDRRLCVLGWF